MRRVIICSGITTSGKSFWRRKLKEALGLADRFVVDFDAVRVAHWGRERRLTPEEHLFKNELARMEVKKRFIIDEAETVLLEAVMLTVEQHQRPMVIVATELQVRILGLWFTCSR